jgi:hypothetical protein
MYFFDPERGSARRAQAKDKLRAARGGPDSGRQVDIVDLTGVDRADRFGAAPVFVPDMPTQVVPPPLTMS